MGRYQIFGHFLKTNLIVAVQNPTFALVTHQLYVYVHNRNQQYEYDCGWVLYDVEDYAKGVGQAFAVLTQVSPIDFVSL